MDAEHVVSIGCFSMGVISDLWNSFMELVDEELKVQRVEEIETAIS